MPMMPITVNGVAVEIEEGVSVLQACGRAGVYVPTLCADPDLAPAGACRLCIVRIEGMRGLPAACTTPATRGMKVTTDDPEILQVRTTLAHLYLAEHPLDCLTCARSRRCSLQRVCDYLGIRERPFGARTAKGRVDESNPCYAIDMAKCILCGKCVRACAEIQHLGAIDIVGRGSASAVEPFGGGPIRSSSCESCGECVERCPTGALTPRGHLPPEREVSTVCP